MRSCHRGRMIVLARAGGCSIRDPRATGYSLAITGEAALATVAIHSAMAPSGGTMAPTEDAVEAVGAMVVGAPGARPATTAMGWASTGSGSGSQGLVGMAEAVVAQRVAGSALVVRDLDPAASSASPNLDRITLRTRGSITRYQVTRSSRITTTATDRSIGPLSRATTRAGHTRTATTEECISIGRHRTPRTQTARRHITNVRRRTTAPKRSSTRRPRPRARTAR